MTLKVFRPFWSYDVEKTEHWLSTMADKGLTLAQINRGTRFFSFLQGIPQKTMYRIRYDHRQNDAASAALSHEGWKKSAQSGHWVVLLNTHSPDQIRIPPSRDGIIKHNRMIMYIFQGILIYLAAMAVLFTGISLLVFSQKAPVRWVESPLWILTALYFLLLVILCIVGIYSTLTIKKTNQNLIRKHTYIDDTSFMDPVEEKLSKEAEKQLKQSEKIVIKRNLWWRYAPDQLEEWLEAMEIKGYHLYRVSRTGNAFFFRVGQPRWMSYCADYQNPVEEGNPDIYKNSGWRSIYSSTSFFQNESLWRCEYSAGEERPSIYNDNNQHLQRARRRALTYSYLFVPLLALYSFIIISRVVWISNISTNPWQWANTALLVLTPLIFAYFLIRIWGYFLRLKKRYKYPI